MRMQAKPKSEGGTKIAKGVQYCTSLKDKRGAAHGDGT